MRAAASRLGPYAAQVQSEPFNPARVLAAMGRAARETSSTWTMRQWAGVLATRAAPHDYVGQLRELYRGIVKRMRYVQEPEEWIYGTARAALGFGLGAAYNKSATCPDPENCDVEGTLWRQLGFGDCDDMSIIAAAGALALGCRPVFRVSRGAGWAHVSVTARTPAGQWVELDPVAYPRHSRPGEAQPGFNWAVEGPGVRVEHFDLEGKPSSQSGEGGSMFGAYTNPGPRTPHSTYFAGFVEPNPNEDDGWDVGGVESIEPEGHLVAVGEDDTLGPRVVAMPHDEADMFRRGACVDGATGVTQFGEVVNYCARRDLWIPQGSDDAPMGFFGNRAERRAKRKARRVVRRRKIGKFFKKIGQGIKRGAMAIGKAARKVVGGILSSKIVQRILARTLSAFGIPAILSRKLMAVAGKFVQEGGLIKLFKLLRKNPKEALRMLAGSVAAAGRGILSAVPDMSPQLAGFGAYDFGGAFGAFAGVDEEDDAWVYQVDQDGHRFHAAPVAGIAGLPGVASFGVLELAPVPTPGAYYQVSGADKGLLDIAGRAYGFGPGSDRLERAKWISAAQTNSGYLREPKGDFELKNFHSGITSLSPKFACVPAEAIAGKPGNCFPVLWIPPAKGVEAPPDIPAPAPGPEPPQPDPIPSPPIPPAPVPPPPPVPPNPPAPPLPPSPAPPMPPMPPVPPQPGPGPGPGPGPERHAGAGLWPLLMLAVTAS